MPVQCLLVVIVEASKMVAALGGPTDFMDKAQSYLPTAPVVRPCFAETSGYVTGMDARDVGVAVVGLGGGRRRASDGIDYAVGLSDVCHAGDEVNSEKPLAMIHAASEDAADAAEAELRAAIRVGDADANSLPIVHQRIAGFGA